MANEKQLELLRRGVTAWNEERRSERMGFVDLSGADLSKAHLCNANLTGVNLRGADLSGANLYQADLAIRSDLSGANLSDASLIHARLSGTDLTGANLSGARLLLTDMRDTDLIDARFNNSWFANTVFAACDLTRAKGLDTVKHIGRSSLDFETLRKSWPLPVKFLRNCGLPEALITHLPVLLNSATEYFSCFISYSHADKSFARRLLDTLQGRGIRCWLDDREMIPGENLYEQVDRGIRLWDKVLLCCSEQSLTSPWVDKEIERALRKEEELWKRRKEGVSALIPLDLDGYVFNGWKSGKAVEITGRFVANFRGWENSNSIFEEQVERVIRALRTDEGGREPAPPPKL